MSATLPPALDPDKLVVEEPYVSERITKDMPGPIQLEMAVEPDSAERMAGFFEHCARMIRAYGGITLTATPPEDNK